MCPGCHKTFERVPLEQWESEGEMSNGVLCPFCKYRLQEARYGEELAGRVLDGWRRSASIVRMQFIVMASGLKARGLKARSCKPNPHCALRRRRT